jgi:hypothetical protein
LVPLGDPALPYSRKVWAGQIQWLRQRGWCEPMSGRACLNIAEYSTTAVTRAVVTS